MSSKKSAGGDVLAEVLGKDKPAPEKAPEPRERKPKRSPARITRDQEKSLREGIQTVLVLGSMGAGMAWPNSWTPEDQFAPDEVEKLADALYNELALYPGVVHWLTTLDKAGPHLVLAVTVLSIAAPRLARRNIIPSVAGMALAGLGGLASGISAAAEGVAPGGPSRPDRPDKKRKEHLSVVSPEISEVAHRLPEQDGPGESAAPLSGGEGGEDIQGTDLNALLEVRAEAAV
ncbi:MAG: hypothetical protein KGJ45_11450 [Elusimicrobia bacterium]|nr:hypothetical protein [Elusimicrobiota bacterium]